MGIVKFFTEGALIGGVRNWVWLAIATIIGAIVCTVIQIADNRDERMIETAKEGGASEAVVEGQRDILTQVERANNAEQEIHRSGDAARYDRCLRNATADTRANCERFRPMPN